jgi:hypothetical protein
MKYFFIKKLQQNTLFMCVFTRHEQLRTLMQDETMYCDSKTHPTQKNQILIFLVGLSCILLFHTTKQGYFNLFRVSKIPCVRKSFGVADGGVGGNAAEISPISALAGPAASHICTKRYTIMSDRSTCLKTETGQLTTYLDIFTIH